MKVRRLTDIAPLNAAKALARLTQAAADKSRVSDTADKSRVSDALSDSELFHSLIGPVRQYAPVATPNQKPPPAPDAAMHRKDEAQVLVELAELPDDIHLIDGSEHISYLAEGQSPKLLRQLKRAQFRISDEFDLHHLRLSVAKKLLHQVLHECRSAGKLCVLLVHGKGLRSGAAGAVLKSMVDFELRRRKDVIAFHSAPPGMGGSGAVMVLLQRARA
jgi:DNA-nicking Smr family endonuclease